MAELKRVQGETFLPDGRVSPAAFRVWIDGGVVAGSAGLSVDLLTFGLMK
jgi:hypothetical protein